MVDFTSSSTISVGEAMVELAPVGEGHYKRGFAGDTFNTAWHMAQALQGRARVGRVDGEPVRAQLDAAVVDLFGFHALQLGLPELQGLRANRMPHRWLALPEELQSVLAADAGEPDAAPGQLRVALVTDAAALPFPAGRALHRTCCSAPRRWPRPRPCCAAG